MQRVGRQDNPPELLHNTPEHLHPRLRCSGSLSAKVAAFFQEISG